MRKPSGALDHYRDFDSIKIPKNAIIIADYSSKNPTDSKGNKNSDLRIEQAPMKKQLLLSPKEGLNKFKEKNDNRSIAFAQNINSPEVSPIPKTEIKYKVVHGSTLLPNLPTDFNEGIDKNTIIIGSYRITKTLGQGTFGKVKEGIHLFTN